MLYSPLKVNGHSKEYVAYISGSKNKPIKKTVTTVLSRFGCPIPKKICWN